MASARIEDKPHAFRLMPVKERHHCVNVIAVVDARFFFGFVFGLKSAVSNFNRWPRFLHGRWPRLDTSSTSRRAKGAASK